LHLEAARRRAIVLGFRYEARNAPGYKFNNFQLPTVYHLTKFQRNRTMGG